MRNDTTPSRAPLSSCWTAKVSWANPIKDKTLKQLYVNCAVNTKWHQHGDHDTASGAKQRALIDPYDTMDECKQACIACGHKCAGFVDQASTSKRECKTDADCQAFKKTSSCKAGVCTGLETRKCVFKSATQNLANIPDAAKAPKRMTDAPGKDFYAKVYEGAEAAPRATVLLPKLPSARVTLRARGPSARSGRAGATPRLDALAAALTTPLGCPRNGQTGRRTGGRPRTRT